MPTTNNPKLVIISVSTHGTTLVPKSVTKMTIPERKKVTAPKMEIPQGRRLWPQPPPPGVSAGKRARVVVRLSLVEALQDLVDEEHYILAGVHFDEVEAPGMSRIVYTFAPDPDDVRETINGVVTTDLERELRGLLSEGLFHGACYLNPYHNNGMVKMASSPFAWI